MLINRPKSESGSTTASYFILKSNERQCISTQVKGLEFELQHISRCLKQPIRCLTEKPLNQLHLIEQTTSMNFSVKDYFDRKCEDFFKRHGRKVFGNLPAVQISSNLNPTQTRIKCVHLYPIITLFIIVQRQSGKGNFAIYYPLEMIRMKNLENQFSELATAQHYDKNFLKEYDITLVEGFAQADARLLDNPILKGKKENLKNGTWKLDDYFLPASFSHDFQWMVVNFRKRRGVYILGAPDAAQMDELMKNLIGNANQNGLRLNQPGIIHTENYGTLWDLRISFCRYIEFHKKLALLLFIIPDNANLYNDIKLISEPKHGIVMQCVAHRKSDMFFKHAYCQHLMLKINNKLRSVNVHLD